MGYNRGKPGFGQPPNPSMGGLPGNGLPSFTPVGGDQGSARGIPGGSPGPSPGPFPSSDIGYGSTGPGNLGMPPARPPIFGPPDGGGLPPARPPIFGPPDGGGMPPARPPIFGPGQMTPQGSAVPLPNLITPSPGPMNPSPGMSIGPGQMGLGMGLPTDRGLPMVRPGGEPIAPQSRMTLASMLGAGRRGL